jgi:hypothetical protein
MNAPRIGIDPMEFLAALVLAWLAVAALGLALSAVGAVIGRMKARLHPPATPPTPLPH